jgi:hypothetical protein
MIFCAAINIQFYIFIYYLFSTTRLVPSPTASAATAAVTDGLSPLTSTTTEAAEAAGGDTGGTIFVVTIVPIFTGEPFKNNFLVYIFYAIFYSYGS